LDLDEPNLPGVGEELLLIASVTHLRRPNLERAAWQAVALAAPKRGPQRLKVRLQEPRHAVDRRLVSLVHHLLPRLQALDLGLDELPALLDGKLGLPNLADGPLGLVVVVDLETVVVSLHLLLDVAEIVLSNAHRIETSCGVVVPRPICDNGGEAVSPVLPIPYAPVAPL